MELGGFVRRPKHFDLANVGVPAILVVGDDGHLHKEGLQVRLPVLHAAVGDALQ